MLQRLFTRKARIRILLFVGVKIIKNEDRMAKVILLQRNAPNVIMYSAFFSVLKHIEMSE